MLTLKSLEKLRCDYGCIMHAPARDARFPIKKVDLQNRFDGKSEGKFRRSRLFDDYLFPWQCRQCPERRWVVSLRRGITIKPRPFKEITCRHFFGHCARRKFENACRLEHVPSQHSLRQGRGATVGSMPSALAEVIRRSSTCPQQAL